MSRSSKRKPKKRTFFDERDSENDENSNNIDELGFNKGKEGNYDKEDDREQTNNSGLGLLANLENIACSVTKTGGRTQWVLAKKEEMSLMIILAKAVSMKNSNMIPRMISRSKLSSFLFCQKKNSPTRTNCQRRRTR